MAKTDSRFIFVVSTGGSVMNEVLRSSWLRSVVHSVVADRSCGGLEKAHAQGVRTQLFEQPDVEVFCGHLSDYMAEHGIEWVISFYTSFYSHAFRERHPDRIINFHPSLLPAFKGMDGFGDGMAYHTGFIGTTVELIKDVMDEGKIVMQTALPRDPHRSREAMRHDIFVQQCKTLLQVVKWICDERLSVSGDQVEIAEASFDDPHFSPALDFGEALAFDKPYSGD